MMQRHRIAIGQFAQETNSFVPFRTEVEHFARRRLLRGADALHGWGDERTEVPGLLAAVA